MSTEFVPFQATSRGAGEAGPVLAFAGDLDITAVARAGEVLAEQQRGDPSLVLDLTGLRFIDSSGLRVVLEAHRRAADRGGRLRVVPGSAGVRRVFALSGVEGLLELVDAPPDPGGAP